MTDASASGRADGRIEIATALVLSVAGLMTTWAGYQAALWDGEQAAGYTRANDLRTQASRTEIEADGRRAGQMALFNAWLQAQAMDDRRLAGFYQGRFPPELGSAFQAWLALKPLQSPNAPQTPFVMPGYQAQGAADAQRLEREADAAFHAGEAANKVSDLYTRGSVFLATALFFGGIAQVFKVRPVRMALVGIAVLTCAAGVLRIVTLPALQAG